MARILIVDDDDVTRKLMKRILDPMGHEVDCADNGADGLGMARSHEYDLILSDVLMPGLRGDQLARALREHDVKAPIYLMSGDTGDAADEVQALVAAGVVTGFLAKPVNPMLVRQLAASSV